MFEGIKNFFGGRGDSTAELDAEEIMTGERIEEDQIYKRRQMAEAVNRLIPNADVRQDTVDEVIKKASLSPEEIEAVITATTKGFISQEGDSLDKIKQKLIESLKN